MLHSQHDREIFVSFRFVNFSESVCYNDIQWVRYNDHQKFMRCFFSNFYIFAININEDESITYNDTKTNDMTKRNEKQQSMWICHAINSIRLFHKFLSVCLFVVNTFYFEYLQSIKTRRLLKIRKIQIRKVWNNIRLRNRYRFVVSIFVFVFVWFWNIDRFIILICKYFSHRSKSRFSTRFSFLQLSHISFVFVFAFFAFAFTFSRLSFLLWVFLFLSWSDWCLNHNRRISSQCRSIKKMIYSFRDEVWKRRKNNVTNMFWKKFRLDFILSTRILMWINVDLTHIFIFDIQSSCTYLFSRSNIFVLLFVYF